MRRISTGVRIKRLHCCLALITGLLLGAVASARGQQALGTLSGTVSTSDKQPLPYASVLLRDTRYGAMAGDDGRFSFQAPAGSYRLIITYAGYTTTEKVIDVGSGEELDLGVIFIDAGSTQLRAVVVEDIQTNKFGKKASASAARMPLANLENPQVYSVIPKELMQEQVAVDYNSAMKSVPGAVITNGVNDSGNDVVMRGFRAQSNFRNGLSTDPRTQVPIFNLEKVEVLKGPSGTLFGGTMSSYGGVVNNITKRPYESFRGEVAYTAGSWGLNRFTADINTPLNADRTALLRLNAVGHMQNSFQDGGYERNFGFAASMVFKPNDRTTVRFDADIYSPEKPLLAYTRTTPGLTATSVADLDIPFDRSLSSNDIGTRRSMVNALAEIEYKLSDHWVSRTSFFHSQSGDKQSIFFVPYYINNQQIERRFRIFEDYQNVSDHLQQNFNGNFEIGGLQNRIVMGLDFFSFHNQGQEMNPYFQVYDTVGIHDPAWTPLSRFDIEQFRAARSDGSSTYSSETQTYSAYASDVLNISENLMAMLSLRLDHFVQKDNYNNGISGEDGYHQTTLSPKFGLVYQPVKDKVSLFANYMNGFVNMGSGMGVDNPDDPNEEPTLRNWKAEEANQWEAGMKVELLDGKLSGTLSYFNIDVKNRLRSIDAGVSVQDGTQISKGLEVDVIANPLPGWNIVAGYGYNDNEYIKDADGNRGKRAPWTPVNTGTFWMSYKFMHGSAKGLGAGFGANYVDKSYFDVDEKFSVPAYTLLNATLFYDQPKYRVGFKLNNLANEHYWDFFGKPQKPREFIVSISYKF